ncbi:putative PAP2 family protein [Giardia duodenalis assemblage B]|uniref:Putative PAP2 family protein n=1 Tax=Giardia duodenalis assemblage B TaxID=1394984 RepID=A0A132NW44_GIAIN|nr:putative PAP2 family protein [Giardia intestinalis assemblage B]
MEKYRPVFLSSPCIAILSVFTFIVPTLILILMSIFRNQLANIDKMIAAYMRYAPDDSTHSNPLPYNTGFIYYLNVSENAIIVIPIIYIGVMLVLFWVATRTKLLLPYLYVLVAAIAYIGMANLLTLILKIALNRPRPRQIAEFTTLSGPTVEFMPVFSRYTGPNPSNLKLYSTPSGHTMFMASALFSLPILTYLLAQMYSKIIDGKRASSTSTHGRFRYMLWLVFFYLGVSVTAVFAILMPPTMAYARYAASAHFFTDTVVSIVLAFLCLVLIFISLPDLRYLKEISDSVVCKDEADQDTHQIAPEMTITTTVNTLPP